MVPDRTTLAAFFAVVLFGGVNAIAIRQMVLELPPLWSMTIRFVPAGLIMGALAILLRRPFPRGQSLRGAVVYGAVAFAAAFGFVSTGIHEGVLGATASVLISITPLVTFILAVAQRQERFHVQGLAGALIALLGIAIVFAEQVQAAIPIGALLLVIVGAAAIAEGGIMLKAIPKSDPFATNAVAMLTGSAVLLAGSFALGETHEIPTRTSTWLALGYLVILGSVVLFSLYLYVLQRWTASAVSYSTLLFPFVGVAVGTLLTGERFEPAFFAGGSVMLLGVYVGAFRARPHRTSATSAPECLPIDNCADEPAAGSAPARA
jgi:drug/metabolite transporter (DMT)-like permease